MLLAGFHFARQFFISVAALKMSRKRPKGREKMEKQAMVKAYQDGQSAAKRGFIGDVYNQYGGARYPELWESWKKGNESFLKSIDGRVA